MQEKKIMNIRLEGGEYATTANKMYLSRKPWQPDEPGTILSFMPGTVERINVQAGDEVRRGEVLMVFRAMKMSNNILAPADGRVKSVDVEAGDNLPKNTVMLRLE